MSEAADQIPLDAAIADLLARIPSAWRFSWWHRRPPDHIQPDRPLNSRTRRFVKSGAPREGGERYRGDARSSIVAAMGDLSRSGIEDR
jgi:hypothetical protein